MTKTKTDPCEFCGEGRLRPGRVTVDLRRGRDLLVIEDVPARVCDRCGHRTYHADVVSRLQRLQTRRSKAKRKLKVPILKFDAVA